MGCKCHITWVLTGEWFSKNRKVKVRTKNLAVIKILTFVFRNRDRRVILGHTVIKWVWSSKGLNSPFLVVVSYRVSRVPYSMSWIYVIMPGWKFFGNGRSFWTFCIVCCVLLLFDVTSLHIPSSSLTGLQLKSHPFKTVSIRWHLFSFFFQIFPLLDPQPNVDWKPDI